MGFGLEKDSLSFGLDEEMDPGIERDTHNVALEKKFQLRIWVTRVLIQTQICIFSITE